MTDNISGEKHRLESEWTMWELRKADARVGLRDWTQLPLPLYHVGTVEDFWICWKRAPRIAEVLSGGNDSYTMKIKRDEKDEKGGIITRITTAEAYMLFRKGIQPITEYETAPGKRATAGRWRCEVAVAPRDFDKWGVAWEIICLALIGEIVDPAHIINGVYLQDKHSGKQVALRLDIWFAIEDDVVCDAVAEELRSVITEEMQKRLGVTLPINFAKIVRGVKKGGRK
jgi:Eukaryotic initiation factor 4E